MAGIVRSSRSRLPIQDSDGVRGRAGPFGSGLVLDGSPWPLWACLVSFGLSSLQQACPLRPLQAKVPGTCLLTIRVLQAHGLPSKDLGECWAQGGQWRCSWAQSGTGPVGRDSRAGRAGGPREGAKRRCWGECRVAPQLLLLPPDLAPFHGSLGLPAAWDGRSWTLGSWAGLGCWPSAGSGSSFPQ